MSYITKKEAQQFSEVFSNIQQNLNDNFGFPLTFEEGEDSTHSLVKIQIRCQQLNNLDRVIHDDLKQLFMLLKLFDKRRH